MQQIIVGNQFKFRFMIYNPFKRESIPGDFLFDEPKYARDTEIALIKCFPDHEIWLEDRDGNRVAIPR